MSIRLNRPCIILDREYWWEPCYEWSYELMRSTKRTRVFIWGSETGYGTHTADDLAHDYLLTFEEAARVIELKYLTGAI